MMNPIDILILISSLIFSLIFVFIGIQRIFSLYIGLILGFFIFLSLSLEIDLLEYTNKDSNSLILSNLYLEKDFYLSLTIFTFPLYAIIFAIFAPKSQKSYYVSIIFGLLLPFLIIGFISFIGIRLGNDFYLNELFYDYLIGSVIFHIFSNNIVLFFYLLFFLIFGKVFYFVGKILLHFTKRYFKTFYNWIINNRKQVREEKLEDMIKKHKI